MLRPTCAAQLLGGLLGGVLGCASPITAVGGDASDGSGDGGSVQPERVTITSTVNSTRFVVREHMLAGAEMQLSGEPLAQAMGRSVMNYSRDRVPTDLYFDPTFVLSWTDLAGFSSAIESYEYSKQPMNELAFEAGAGTSLAFGPLVSDLAADVQHYAAGANTLGRFVFAPNTYPARNASGNTNPDGAGLAAANPLGWPGIWPTAHVFASFDPAIEATGAIALECAITSDDDPDGMTGARVINGDYECDASSLHLRDRTTQIDPTITPGADGFSGWKYGLWVINYLQIMHDRGEAPVDAVADPATVGSPGSDTFLGSSDIEGFQAQLFIAMMDNRAEDWLAHLSTSDGSTLTGFTTLAAALAYDYTSPLRWFPGSIGVTETGTGPFAQPNYSLQSADSELLDLAGMMLAYAEFYALTDTSNRAVGGAQPVLVLFDGDPFAADDQIADGEPTLHDRSLAMLRVAVINLDRMHTDPASGLLVDTVAMAGATATRGHTISTATLAYTVIAMRTVVRSLSGSLELYSNNTPDAGAASTPLDPLALHYPGNAGLTFSARLGAMLRAQAQVLYEHLTDASGRAWSGWDVRANTVTDDRDLLDAHTAAVRGLFAAYLATGDTRYRDRAIAVYDRLEAVFYDSSARVYGATPAPVASVEYTPLRFALLQSTLRDMYELVATRPGGEPRVAVLEDRLARLNKLVLNGWDDRDRNRLIAWPSECTSVVDGVPRGGLQMAERTLTGELGSLQAPLLPGDVRIATSDREHDCVPEIDDARLPAALADSITLHLTRSP